MCSSLWLLEVLFAIFLTKSSVIGHLQGDKQAVWSYEIPSNQLIEARSSGSEKSSPIIDASSSFQTDLLPTGLINERPLSFSDLNAIHQQLVAFQQPNQSSNFTGTQTNTEPTNLESATSEPSHMRLSSADKLQNYQDASDRVDQQQIPLIESNQAWLQQPDYLHALRRSNTNAARNVASNWINLLDNSNNNNQQQPVATVGWLPVKAQNSANKQIRAAALYQPSQASVKSNSFFKNYAAKQRRSQEQMANLMLNQEKFPMKVSFDDAVEGPISSSSYIDYSGIKPRFNYPMNYVADSTYHAKQYSRYPEDEAVNLMIDNLIASSKYTPSLITHPFYQHQIALPLKATPHRKSLEKSLGISILVGIGAALISFLIISNIFLSIPLFAMTLLQLFNGNNMIMPNNNNNNPPNPNNNNNNPSPNNNGQGGTASGRRKRNIESDTVYTEQRLKNAIDRYTFGFGN